MLTAPGTHYQHFYIKGKDKRPVPKITVCYIRTEKDTSVGVAICSPKDNPIKSKGRRLAYGRAIAAQNGVKLPITREEARLTLLLARLYEASDNRRDLDGISTKAFKVNDPKYLMVNPKP